ncbi:unnamed protein product, partial [Rotaria magnacalcarata]
FDPRYFRPLMVTLRVALHNITAHLLHHTDLEPCPIGFCERLCVEMTTNLDETKLQVLFLPVNIYVEDTIVVSFRELVADCYFYENSHEFILFNISVCWGAE